MQIQCPKCKSAMEMVQISSTEVDRCTSCQGIWFDALEDKDVRGKPGAELLDPPGARPPEGKDAQRKVQCPRCSTPLIRMVDRLRRDVTYESCPICYGKFFDAGEFRAVQPVSVIEVFRRLMKGEQH